LNHPVQRILDRPNPLQPAFAFKYSCITDLQITGNSLIFVSKSNRWLVQVPTEIVSLDLSARNDVVAYDIVGVDPRSFPASARTKLRSEDVIHVKRPNPSSVFWGLSPLIPGSNPALFNRYSNEYLLNFYKKGAQPGLIFEMTEEANEVQARKLLASLETAYSGRTNQRRNMVAPKGVKVTDIAHTLADQNLIEYLHNNRETLINIYGVPKHELSIAEAGSLGSEEYKTALKNFWQGPLMAIGSMFESSLTEKLKPWLGENYVIRFNYSNVPILQEDLYEKANLAASMLSTMTYNEVRQKIWKLEPIEGGDVLKDFANQPTFPSFPSFSSASIEPEALPPALVSTEPKSIVSNKEANILAFGDYVKADGSQWFQEQIAEVEVLSRRSANKMENLWLNLLEDQIVEAVKVAKREIEEKAIDVPDKEALQEKMRKAMDTIKSKWVKGFNGILEAQVELGYDTVLNIPMNKPYQDGIDAIRERGKNGRIKILQQRAIDSFDQISETTTAKIMARIEEGMDKSESLAQIVTAIRKLGADAAGRALTIARTETSVANAIGQAEAMKDAAEVIPDLVKVWINANDDRVRGNPGGLYPDASADHWSLMGEIVDAKDTFSNGLRYPKDVRGGAGEVINCRCSMLVVSEQDLPQLGLKR
jgi:HK97 family phage portal protein